jgi:hypothetical protein
MAPPCGGLTSGVLLHACACSSVRCPLIIYICMCVCWRFFFLYVYTSLLEATVAYSCFFSELFLHHAQQTRIVLQTCTTLATQQRATQHPLLSFTFLTLFLLSHVWCSFFQRCNVYKSHPFMLRKSEDTLDNSNGTLLRINRRPLFLSLYPLSLWECADVAQFHRAGRTHLRRTDARCEDPDTPS